MVQVAASKRDMQELAASAKTNGLQVFIPVKFHGSAAAEPDKSIDGIGSMFADFASAMDSGWTPGLTNNNVAPGQKLSL